MKGFQEVLSGESYLFVDLYLKKLCRPFGAEFDGSTEECYRAVALSRLSDLLEGCNPNGRIIIEIGDLFPITHLPAGGWSVAPSGLNLLVTLGNCYRSVAPLGLNLMVAEGIAAEPPPGA